MLLLYVNKYNIQTMMYNADVSSGDMKYLNIAAEEATKSKVLMRHGSVAVCGGKVMGRGHNSYRTSSKDNFIKNTCACHAEIACMRNMFMAYNKTNNRNRSNIKVAQGIWNQR